MKSPATELPPPPSAATSVRLLVIGYGHSLFGDDGAGPLVADGVAAWGRPGVRALARQELVPELAAELAETGRAVFVDAALAGTRVKLARLAPAPAARGSSGLGHALTPARLLALTLALYGRHPRAWLLTVPGTDFLLGRSLSPAARSGVDLALGILRRYV